jgi:hypothetical protein
MRYYQKDDGDVAAGWATALAIGGAIIIGLAFLAFMVKIVPLAFRGMICLTKLLLPHMAMVSHRCLGWPSSVQISTQGTASTLGLILWGNLGLLMGIALFLLGSQPVVILIMIGIGVFTGALAGAASVGLPTRQGHDLEDYVSF